MKDSNGCMQCRDATLYEIVEVDRYMHITSNRATLAPSNMYQLFISRVYALDPHSFENHPQVTDRKHT